MAILLGTLGADDIDGTASIDIITALSGDDTIIAGDGADIIDAGGNNDIVYAASVNNWVDGDLDTVLAGAGDDTVYGAWGDALGGGSGFDRLAIDLSNAGSGVDVDFRPMTLGIDIGLGDLLSVAITLGGADLDGFEAVSHVIGTDENDSIIVGNRDKVATIMEGGDGNDMLRAGNGADTILGGTGEDKLRGMGGKDALTGGLGVDKLDGGVGRDVLTGGADADRFLFGERESAASRARADVITDFSQAQGDRIGVQAIDAIVGGDDDRFDFIGSSRFSGTAGELRFVTVGENTFVSGDTNGDARADFTIQVAGQIDLVAADFVF